MQSYLYTMQELVKEVTLINHMNNINGFAILNYSLGGILNYNFLSVLIHVSPTIQYIAGHSYKINTHYNTGADEFVAWD